MTTWNEAMYYFSLVPSGYRKMMFVSRQLRHGWGMTLAEHYVRNHGHLVPLDVELWECDQKTQTAIRVRIPAS
jgi:hypothetical protein